MKAKALSRVIILRRIAPRDYLLGFVHSPRRFGNALLNILKADEVNPITRKFCAAWDGQFSMTAKENAASLS